MRYILAAIFLCAIAMPASAAPKSAPGKSSASKAASAQTEKRGRAAVHHQNKDAGGIHPLVGSGDY
jgi:hypothetical protein